LEITVATFTTYALSVIETPVTVLDTETGGTGTITGTTKLKGTPTNTPLGRKVRLIRERDGYVVRELISDALTGVYTFSGISTAHVYSVVSYDPITSNRAVIADGIVAV
jgi:hypothetical protein